jgi:hypothetical protein
VPSTVSFDVLVISPEKRKTVMGFPEGPPDAPALSPIRSLAYFQPVIDELLSSPAPANYTEYLRLKLHQLTKRNPDLKKEAASCS